MKRLVFIVSMVAAVSMVAPANADLTLNLNVHFSGDQPLGTLTATITDVAADTVTLVLTSNLVGTEFIDGSSTPNFGWGFNLNSTLVDLGSVMIGQDSGPAAVSDVSEDAFKADGDGFFDMLFSWPDSGDRLGAGDSAEFTIMGTGLSAASFYAFSAAGGGEGTYLSAAHVQGVGAGAEGSGWIGAIPAPGAVVLGALGLGLVGSLKRRRS